MREERIEKAFFGEHHGPGDDAKAMLLRAPSGVNIDVVLIRNWRVHSYIHLNDFCRIKSWNASKITSDLFADMLEKTAP